MIMDVNVSSAFVRWRRWNSGELHLTGCQTYAGFPCWRRVQRPPLRPLDTATVRLYPDGMEVHLSPEMQAKLDKLATDTGRSQNEFVEDAMAGYLDELGQVRGMLDSRYDDIKSGRVKPIDGEEAFARLREKSEKWRSGRK